MSFNDNLKAILHKHAELTDRLSKAMPGDEFVRLSKEYAELEQVVVRINEYNKVLKELEEVQELANEKDLDNETEKAIEEERVKLEGLIPGLERAVKVELLPKDDADSKSAIIEVRAGTGGEEAALF